MNEVFPVWDALYGDLFLAVGEAGLLWVTGSISMGAKKVQRTKTRCTAPGIRGGRR